MGRHHMVPPQGKAMGETRTTRASPLVAILGLALTFASGCANEPATNSPTTKTALVVKHDGFDRPRALFQEICAGCHMLIDAGTHGNWNMDESILERLPRQTQRARSARKSMESGASIMPRWKGVLSTRDFNALVAYIAAVTGGTPPPQPLPPSKHPPRDRFTDERVLFDQACAGCHALADADAHGTRFDLDTSSVSKATTYVQRRAITRHAILHGQADAHDAGVGMPAWTTLKPEVVDALATYVATVAGQND